MRSVFLGLLLCSGCFDYNKLSSTAHTADMADGKTDGPAVDGGSDVDAAQVQNTDAAIADGALASTDGAVATLYPASCLSIRLATPSATDGTYTLYVGNNPAKPWSVFCKDMGFGPKEYLVLVNTSANQNFSQYTAGGLSPGTDVKTNYTRLRVDPVTLKVDTSDQTYATSTGALTQAQTITAMPYAVAMDCFSMLNVHMGMANLDLRSTPFAIAANAFVLGGYLPSGTATYSAANQVAWLTGGGGCAWNAAGTYPSGTSPVNSAGGYLLQLVYP